ncbi:hypothetical protein [Metabacillus arenae]|uniref:Abortive phage infection protein n=1 Tax=Metabacillus arenae TaxID=2771434 RepID=A0A926RXQ8_9BACI|nr:hypothetical protein [Metabacillus arenae]MBD1380402.1 hypothetical protein [Metabacillus arenae]
MDEQTVNTVLNELRSGELKEYHVSKDQFLTFRKILVDRVDFKHFRGIAQHGGSVIFRYLENPRS